MKKTLLTIILSLMIPVAALAAAFGPSQLTKTHTTTSMTAAWKFTANPTADTPLYAWIGPDGDNIYGSTWKRNFYLGTIDAGSTLPFEVEKKFVYSDLGLTAGKVYKYALASGTGQGATILADTYGTTFSCFKTDTGVVPCPGTGGGTPPVTPCPATGCPREILFSPLSIIADPANLRVIVKTQFSAPDGDVQNAEMVMEYGAKGGPLNQKHVLYTGTIPVSGVSVSNDVFGVGNDGEYDYRFVEESLGKVWAGGTFSMTATGNQLATFGPSLPPTSPTAPVVPIPGTELFGLGGLTITFPRNEQVLTEKQIEIHGKVVASVTVPTNLQVVSGKAGTPLGNAKSLFSGTMNGGDTRAIVVTLTDLEPGQKYYFAFKNTSTNSVSSPIYFTTPGGATNEAARFAGQKVGAYDAPEEVVFEDTVSDKGIVPKCGRTAGPNVDISEVRMCDYKDFMKLISNIITFVIILIGPIVAIYAMYAGAMIIIYGKNPDPSEAIMKKLRAYKMRLIYIGGGLLIIFLAWTLIATILIELGVKENYILLDIFSG